MRGNKCDNDTIKDLKTNTVVEVVFTSDPKTLYAVMVTTENGDT